ncbi:MAG TPA: hypothetical protein VGN42_07110 [Pirellulales bacterium]|jgi:hypothetical protein|nr:hypothetical protein [Pirellulales bacterium]
MALNPKSPEVKALVEKAVKFLEQPLPQQLAQMPNSTAPGAKALVGMCMLKAGRPNNHPKVIEAAESIRKVATEHLDSLDVYNLGLCIVFLIDFDPAAYQPEIQKLTERLIQVQKPHGGWGYPAAFQGDTSMSQYGCLALWAAVNAGLSVPQDSFERACNWWLRTQDPSGAFGYQGVDSGGAGRVAQNEVRHSLAAAGLGSLYICGDRLRLFGVRDEPVDSNQPPELRRKKKEIVPVTTSVDKNRVQEAMDLGKAWQRAKYSMDVSEWSYYYMYAYERYQSFRENTPGEGKPDVSWYDDGVKFLTKTQRPDGSWDSAPGHNTIADTTFGILFLLRSTQQFIQHVSTLGGGTLTGGRGLPENMDGAQMRLGGVRAKRLSASAKSLISIISGDPNDPNFEAAAITMEEEQLEPGDETLTDVAKQLRTLAAGQAPEARAAALRALARLRNLDDVPLLIEALKDPEPLVFNAANEGLRFISRKFYGAGFWPGSDEPAREAARKQWKQWYLSIRPNAILED